MANPTFYFLVAFVLLLSGADGHDSHNFPLRDCSTGQFDILILQTRGAGDHLSLPRMITNAWIEGDNKYSRVQISTIKDTSTWRANKCEVNMTRFDGAVTDLCNIFPSNSLRSTSLHVDIKMKIKLAATILSDMDVGRHNSTHVAVIIYDSSNFPTLTVDEVRSIPYILQGDSSDTKVFVILHAFGNDVEPILLGDTIIAGNHMTQQHVSLALCKQCMSGWFKGEHKETDTYISCYKLHISPTNIDWAQASSTCASKRQYLATIESKEELAFLQEQLLFLLSTNRPLFDNSGKSAHDSVEVYIGLRRNYKSAAKRFQWALKNPNIYHPLVINHWLPGNPVGGISLACGVWFFSNVFNKTFAYDLGLENASTGNSLFTGNRSNVSEGWSSVGCGIKLSHVSLCEVTLTHHVKEQDVVRLEEASKEQFYRVLNQPEFQEYEGKIVSISAYVNNKQFLNFLKVKNTYFPMFDCGDDAEDPRYIAYSFVSDFINHCSNGRDEAVHPARVCFTCQCIPDEAICDNVIDCRDGSDEDECESCKGRRCCDGTCLPSHFFNDGEIDCSNCQTTDNGILNDETRTEEDYIGTKETCAFICNYDQCIYPSQLNDGNLDCTGPEGHLDETIGKLETTNSCSDISGRPVWAPRCVYLKDRYGSVLGCRDLSHLQKCQVFVCQEGYYKCPGSYCIPLHYVMDGKSDCPSGEEERHIVTYTCVGNFACWNSSVCLHPDLVCDGAAQCPHKDDELNCGVSCIDGLICLAGTVAVDNNNPLIHLDNFTFLSGTTRYLDLSGVDLSKTECEFFNYVFLFDIKMSGCNMLDLYYNFPLGVCCMFDVYKLDLSFNLIVSIDGNKFYYGLWVNLRELNLSYNTKLEEFVSLEFEYLETLDLTNTGLSYLDKRSFYGFGNLKYLRLRYTRLSTFNRDMFPTPFTLQTLDIRGSPIVKFFQNTYNGLIITSSLYTDNFGLCCPQVRGSSVPEYMCHASEDPISSCFDLIGVDIQQILIWSMAGIAFFGNLTVTLYRLIWDTNVLEKAYGLFVLNLAISDIIMGLYLLIIAVADVYYRGVYVVYENEWKESIFCKLASSLSILSSETSTFFIFLITMDRFLTLTFPYGEKQFSKRTKVVVVAASWSFGLILALIPVLSLVGNHKMLTSTAMCSGLLVTNQRVNGWEYSLCGFIVLNGIMFLFTALGQIGIYKSMSGNRMPKESTNQNSLRRAQDITVAKQLSLVVLSNFLCWFPVGLIGILSLSGRDINNDVFAWTVVLVLPVNSAINPFLYTIPVLKAKWDKFKHGSSRPQ